MTDKEWRIQCAYMGKMYTGVAGEKIIVKDVEMDQLGYTEGNNVVHVAREHEIMQGLTKNEKRIFRLGVGSHELLHHELTDFTLRRKLVESYPIHEQRIVAMIDNILEDPAIEFFAPQIFGGVLLDALHFSIKHVYHLSREIEVSKSAFAQFINALIQFGDMGLIKGKFTFPEARKVFIEAAPVFGVGMEEPIPEKRMNCSRKITEISRPLWQESTEFDKEMMELLKQLEKSGSGNQPNGSGKPQSIPYKPEGQTISQKRRSITIMKVSQEELEEIKKKGETSEGELPQDGDITILVCDENTDNTSDKNQNQSIPIPKEKSSDSQKGDNEKNCSCSTDELNNSDGNVTSKKNSSNNSEQAEGTDGIDADEGDISSKIDFDGENTDSIANRTDGDSQNSVESDETQQLSQTKDDGKKDATKDKENASSRDKIKNTDFNGNNAKEADSDKNDTCDSDNDKSDSWHNIDSSNENIPLNSHTNGDGTGVIDNEDCEISQDEYDISEENIREVLTGLEEIEKEETEKKRDEKENKLQNLDFPVSTPRIKKANCKNFRVRIQDVQSISTVYDEVVAKMSKGIASLTSQLREIFRNDVEEIEHYTSGKINLVRANNGKLTPRIFDKKKNPAERDDVVIMIDVDESASMGGEKSRAARNACIAFSEVFARLKIPVYIMGFTTGASDADAVHYHYLTWFNTRQERMKLLNIKGRDCNFDSYSVRYSAEILKKKSAAHKLMVVISDGTPSAKNYRQLGVNGVTDTRDVIRETRKFASVLGVAVGSCDADAIHFIYGNDFIHIDNIDELFSKVSKKLQRIIKNWD